MLLINFFQPLHVVTDRFNFETCFVVINIVSFYKQDIVLAQYFIPVSLFALAPVSKTRRLNEINDYVVTLSYDLVIQYCKKILNFVFKLSHKAKRS